MSQRLSKLLFAIGALALLTSVNVSGHQQSDFAAFKDKMMPQVGHKTTVVGKLLSAKLGWLVLLDRWGVYIYSSNDSDQSKMHALNSFAGQTVTAVGTLRYDEGSRSERTDVASVPEHFFFDVADVEVTGALPAAEATFREMRFRKPPLVDLYFDIVLHNEKRPRWFLLPSNLGSGFPAIAAKGGVDAIEVFNPRGKGRVVIGHFLGTGGFYALLLPANAELRLRMFPISFWGDPPDHVDIEVIAAGGLTIGGEDGSAWFRVDPTSSARADITDEATSSMRMIRSRHTPDRKELPILFQDALHFSVRVSLDKK